MGLYDRDYVREEPRRSFLGGDRSMVVNLVLLNAAIAIADMVFEGKLSDLMKLPAGVLHQPWNLWKLVTAGFAHASFHEDFYNVLHVGMNMFMLWMFGRDVEAIYGRKEFLRIYLSLVILSSLVWLLSANFLTPAERYSPRMSVVGASGAVTGVLVLFVAHFPRRTLLVWGILPAPAWLLCGLYILADIVGFNRSLGGRGGNVAYEAHLAGAAFAYLYYRTGWNLGRLIPGWLHLGRWKRRPKLRVHEPRERQEDLGQRVDRILEKISRDGEASLTSQERRTLEEASRRYQQRRS